MTLYKEVKISDAKSLVSESGGLEFAKLFWVKKVTKNLSPLSYKAVLRGYSTLGVQELASRYNLAEKKSFRLSGAGYRALGAMDTLKLSRRFQRVRALCSKRLRGTCRLPIEWWIGDGLPLYPYLFGELVQVVRESTKLVQLRLLHPTRFASEGESHIVENTLLRNWMDQWLRYLMWYVVMQNNFDPTFESLLEGPYVASSPYRDEVDVKEFLRRGSLIYQVYEMAEGRRTPGWCPPSWLIGQSFLQRHTRLSAPPLTFLRERAVGTPTAIWLGTFLKLKTSFSLWRSPHKSADEEESPKTSFPDEKSRK